VVLYRPNTLATRLELGNATGWAGDRTSARDQFSELLPICVRVLGVEHARPYRCAPNSPIWIREAGDSAAARDLYALLLPIDDASSVRTIPTRSSTCPGSRSRPVKPATLPPPAISPTRWRRL
jgi:hypothetical protein